VEGHDHGEDAARTHDAGHDHSHGHGSDGLDHTHEHDEEAPDVSGWLASTQKLNCPACGATGALPLGGGIFCPTCGEVTTNPGYQAPAAQPGSGQD
jgi:hypothetical protein